MEALNESTTEKKPAGTYIDANGDVHVVDTDRSIIDINIHGLLRRFGLKVKTKRNKTRMEVVK
jgi:hypothetical protein